MWSWRSTGLHTFYLHSVNYYIHKDCGLLTILVRQLGIDTDVIIKAAVLQLRLLLVQVGQLLVALHGPGLCNVTVSHDAGDHGASPAHDPGSHSPQASM